MVLLDVEAATTEPEAPPTEEVGFKTHAQERHRKSPFESV